mmetsp:Transcript_6118/g.14623  ORF Transcript_6118/g.14623 Transcript_6118/m.14623 type:complete len:566 (-) Transcript_6118:80-1777(-)
MASAPVSILLSLLVCLTCAYHGDAFSYGEQDDSLSYISDACPLLMSQLERVLGTDHRSDAQARVRSLEDAIHPLYDALPKNRNGELNAPAVRYMLHRFFRHQYGWQVKGLAPHGDAWNASLATAVLQNDVTVKARVLLEDHLQNDGFSLEEAACLASSLEEVVQAESLARLRVAFKLHSAKTTQAHVPREDLERILDTYMVSYILQLAHVDPQILSDAEVEELYPNWHTTQSFLRKVFADIVPLTQQQITFDDMAGVVRAVSSRYGAWQNQECKELKLSLSSLEGACPGRVDIGDFQGGVEHGKWQFQESEAYLRDLQALDETVPDLPRVIVPNYIISSTNCIGTSKYYSTCCMDECDGIMRAVEAQISAPTAAPDQIVEVINGLLTTSPWATDSQLAEDLIAKLRSLSQTGAGVPIYGRLFAQWLHHVWPQHCPYPSAVHTPHGGSIKFMSTASIASAKERRLNEESTKKAHAGETGGSVNLTHGQACIPWTPTEELLAPLGYTDPNRSLIAAPVVWASLFMLASSVLACISQVAGLQLPRRAGFGSKQFVSGHASGVANSQDI